MIKKQIINYDIDSNEADIVLEQNNNKLLVYAPMFNKNLDCENFDLIAFLPTNIVISSELPSIQKTDDSYYSQKLIGVLAEKTKDLCKVNVLGFNIFLENVPKDIKINDVIEFDCLRIDYIQNLEKECNCSK